LGERRVRDCQIVFRGVCQRCANKRHHDSESERTMGKVARQVVEQTGIDVNVPIDKLVCAASGTRGLVLRIFERRPVGIFPARRALLFALREPLHDSGPQVNLPFYKAGRVDEIPPATLNRCLEGKPLASALGGPVLRARRLMPAPPEPARRRGRLGPSPRLPRASFSIRYSDGGELFP